MYCNVKFDQSFTFAQKYSTKPKISFSVTSQNYRKVNFQITWHFTNIQNTDFGEKIGKINYNKPSVKLKSVVLPHMVKTGSSQIYSLKILSQDVFSPTQLISMDIKSPSWRAFHRGTH